MNIRVLTLLAQIPDPVTPSILKILVDAGVAVILSLAIAALAYALLQQVRSKGKDEEAENNRLGKLVDALSEDRVHLRQVIEGNSETQRLITVAINDNTGSNRAVASSMETVSRDLREYTSLHSDSVEQLVGAIERSESQMVAFGTALKSAVDDIHNNAKDHEEIIELVQKVIDEILVIKLDIRMAFQQMIPPLTPPKQSETLVNVPAQTVLPTQIEVTINSDAATKDAAPDAGSEDKKIA